jgi:hypothetical protein
MIRNTLMTGALSFGLLLGCKEDDSAKHSHGGGGTPAATAASGGESKAAHKDDHDHDHDHAHGGARHDLGKQTVAGNTVSVTQIGDAVVAGKAVTFEIKISPEAGGSAAKPRAVRAWVGNEKAEGSVKANAPWREKFYDADLEVPAKLPAGSKLWVEVENDAGKNRASFDYKAK